MMDEVDAKKRKKGVKNSENYGQQIVKQARISGESYINSAGKQVAKKTTGDECRFVLLLFL